VAGGGIGQVHPAVALSALAAVQVPAGQDHLALLLHLQADGQGSGLRVEGGDGPTGSVRDPELSDGVAAAHHPISHRQLQVLNLEPLLAEASPSGQQLLTGAVEPIHLAAPVGQHDHVLARVAFGVLPGLPPVGEQGQGGGRLGLRTDDPVMRPVGGHRLLHQPGADQLQGLALPGLLLPPVLRKFRGAQPQAEGAKAATGVDGGQLPVIADQHHLGLCLLGLLKEASELAAAQHAGLVHHQHRPVVQPLPPWSRSASSRSQVATSSNPSASKETVAIPVGAVARGR
jgi:hypothetical protein